MFEEHLLLHSANVSASRAVARRPLETWEPALMLSSAEALLGTLGMLGYAVQARLPWEPLGLCWEEGPMPDEAMIEQQARLATQLLRAVCSRDP